MLCKQVRLLEKIINADIHNLYPQFCRLRKNVQKLRDTGMELTDELLALIMLAGCLEHDNAWVVKELKSRSLELTSDAVVKLLMEREGFLYSTDESTDETPVNCEISGPVVPVVQNQDNREMFKIQVYLLRDIIKAEINYLYPRLGFEHVLNMTRTLRESGVELSDEMLVRLTLTGIVKRDRDIISLLQKLEESNIVPTFKEIEKMILERAQDNEERF